MSYTSDGAWEYTIPVGKDALKEFEGLIEKYRHYPAEGESEEILRPVPGVVFGTEDDILKWRKKQELKTRVDFEWLVEEADLTGDEFLKEMVELGLKYEEIELLRQMILEARAELNEMKVGEAPVFDTASLRRRVEQLRSSDFEVKFDEREFKRREREFDLVRRKLEELAGISPLIGPITRGPSSWIGTVDPYDCSSKFVFPESSAAVGTVELTSAPPTPHSWGEPVGR